MYAELVVRVFLFLPVGSKGDSEKIMANIKNIHIFYNGGVYP